MPCIRLEQAILVLLLVQARAQPCSDTPPSSQYTCAQQAAWGQCSQSWMTQGNFCAQTCGRCSSMCTDTPPSSQYTCAQQASFGQCGQQWMTGYCEQTCGRCGTSTSIPAASSCSDTPPSSQYTCAQQAGFGQCNQPWMTQGNYCAKTCGRCGNPSSATPAQSQCTDTPPNTQYTCAQQAGYGQCGQAWMAGYCDISCGRCKPAAQPCSNVQPTPQYTCAQQAAFGQCNEYWMVENNYCAQTCGKCINGVIAQEPLPTLNPRADLDTDYEYNYVWQQGRSTNYGVAPWNGDSIHIGACGYGYLWPDEPLGWDITAMADVNTLFPNSCGVCIEVACRDASFSDGYGNSIDRTSACYNSAQSLVLRVTDNCPCHYPNNAYSNSRWCCGDMTHYDLSVYAFQKLADLSWGVIGINWRRVPCDHTPASPAPPVASPWSGESPPSGAVHYNRGYDWTQYSASWTTVQWTPQLVIWDGQLGDGWRMSQSIGVVMPPTPGAGNLTDLCVVFPAHGALSFEYSGPNPFMNKTDISFAIKMTYGTVPQLDFTLINSQNPVAVPFYSQTGNQAPPLSPELCRTVDTFDLIPQRSAATPDWARFVIYLQAFDTTGCGSRGGTEASIFTGCGGGNGMPDTLRFINPLPVPQQICLSAISITTGSGAGANPGRAQPPPQPGRTKVPPPTMPRKAGMPLFSNATNTTKQSPPPAEKPPKTGTKTGGSNVNLGPFTG